MDLCTILDQQAYFCSCLDPALYASIRVGIDDKMPVLAERGSPIRTCIDVLRAEFRMAYPVLGRRVTWFCRDQKQGESFADFQRYVIEEATECQLDTIDRQELIVLRLLTGVTDKKLAVDLYKLRDPDLKAISELASAHASANRTLDTVTHPKAHAYRAEAQGGKSGSNKSAKNHKSVKTNNSYTNNGNNSGKKNYTCYRCGDKNEKHACKAINATCKYCNKAGHFASVCNKKKADAKTKGNAKARNAEADSDEESTTANAVAAE